MNTAVADTVPPAGPQAHPNQFALLRQHRFAPFFWTQFAGAANDNVFKFASTVMVTYQLQIAWLPPAMADSSLAHCSSCPFCSSPPPAGSWPTSTTSAH